MTVPPPRGRPIKRNRTESVGNSLGNSQDRDSDAVSLYAPSLRTDTEDTPITGSSLQSYPTCIELPDEAANRVDFLFLKSDVDWIHDRLGTHDTHDVHEVFFVGLKELPLRSPLIDLFDNLQLREERPASLTSSGVFMFEKRLAVPGKIKSKFWVFDPESSYKKYHRIAVTMFGTTIETADPFQLPLVDDFDD